MQSLYAYYKNSGTASINDIEKELFFSINKAYDLYHYLLILLIDIANLAEKRLDVARNKKLPSAEDLNPNRKFVDNKVIAALRVNNQLIRYIEVNRLSWVNHPEIIKGLLDTINESEIYKKYMQSNEESFSADKKFISTIYTHILATYEPLYSVLEEQSIFWNDEVEFIISSIVKTVKKLKETNPENAILPELYKNDEDKDFTKNLFRKVILNWDKYEEYVKQFSKNWDLERIAFMDIILINMAIAEVLDFESIPVKVSFNEYIELSKYYSTNRSNVFINGILDKIINHLRSNNLIKKSGRGLIGELP
jgi:N utilization substance protein B